MPGTIQVSILGLVGLPSSSVVIKVSVGKQAYETKDKGDLYFSLVSLRDNLNVLIHDSEGNDIAHTVVETRTIVEKGIWDDLFALKGGGHVHMRLHFNLSEHELNRIRSMRESATRRKQEDLLKRSHSSSDLAVSSGASLFSTVSPVSSQGPLKAAHRVATPSVNLANTQTIQKSAVKGHHDQKKQALPTSLSVGALDKLPVKRQVKEVTDLQNQEHRNPLDKKRSNVKKMILAFETNPVKEEVSNTDKAREDPPQLSSSAGVEVIPEGSSLKEVVSVNVEPDLSNLETTDVASSISERIEKARSKTEDFQEPIQENFGQNPEHLKELRVRNIDQMPSKDYVPKMGPFLSNLETAYVAPSIPEGIEEGRGEIKDFEDPIQESLGQKIEQRKELRVQNIDKTEPVLSKIKAASPPYVSKEIDKERDNLKQFEDPFEEKVGQKTEQLRELKVQNIYQIYSKEDHHKEEKNSSKKLHKSSTFERPELCWNTIAREFPSRKRASTESFTEQKWRSKHWKSSQLRVKSKQSFWNENSSNSFRGWIFLDETICSCIANDDRPFVDVLEGYLCNPETSHGKSADSDFETLEDGKRLTEKKILDTVSPPNEGAPKRPPGQAIKVAIMVGFGLLVFFTRQKK